MPQAETIVACFFFGILYIFASWLIAMDLLCRIWKKEKSVLYSHTRIFHPFTNDDIVIASILLWVFWPIIVLFGIGRWFYLIECKQRLLNFINAWALLVDDWTSEIK